MSKETKEFKKRPKVHSAADNWGLTKEQEAYLRRCIEEDGDYPKLSGLTQSQLDIEMGI